MKNYFILLIVFLLFVNSAMSQIGATKKAPVFDKNLVVFKTTTVDLGKLDNTSKIECEFEFTNKNAIPIHIEEATVLGDGAEKRFTLRCAKEPIAPMETSKIYLLYDMPGRGAFNKHVLVRIENEVYSLTFKGFVKK